MTRFLFSYPLDAHFSSSRFLSLPWHIILRQSTTRGLNEYEFRFSNKNSVLKMFWEMAISEVPYRSNFASLISKNFTTYYILGESPKRGENESEVTFTQKNFPGLKYRECHLLPLYSIVGLFEPRCSWCLYIYITSCATGTQLWGFSPYSFFEDKYRTSYSFCRIVGDGMRFFESYIPSGVLWETVVAENARFE